MLAKYELARRVFWEYCRILAPDFYKEDRRHLRDLCFTLQNLYEGKLLKADGKPYKKLMINMPPQHGKSRTLIYFCDWILGKNQNERIITASYNDVLAGDFAKFTRDGITEVKNIEEQIVFSDIFPGVKVKYGSKSYSNWALEGQHFNYLGTGVGGTITGKGGSILIVDDPIKSAEEALNEAALDRLWQWYTGTFLSRVSAEGGLPIEIFNMTRWSKKDPCGRILDKAEEKNEWYVLQFKAYDKETDSMLCPSLLSYERYCTLKNLMIEEIFLANYNQEPMDVKGRLYTTLNTYDKLPMDANSNLLFTKLANYTDTADQGDDYLCSICYGVYQGCAYVLDVVYTKEPMEITEPMVAEMLARNNIKVADIESNSGGRGFARQVTTLLKEKYPLSRCVVTWFHQSQNKVARILTNSNWVQKNIFFPINWNVRWPEYYAAMRAYQKEGKNNNDDAPDATTGVAEKAGIKTKINFGG